MMMMKKSFLFALLCLSISLAQAQTNRIERNPDAIKPHLNRGVNGSDYLMDQRMNHVPVEQTPNTGGGSTSGNKTSSIEVTEVGRASNAYSIIRSTQTQMFTIDSDNDNEDVVGWIHRQNIGEWGIKTSEGADNGVLRLDVYKYSNERCKSTFKPDEEWTMDIGPLNPVPYPNASRARYPQVVIDNPMGTTNLNDYRAVWFAPTTDGNGWGNYTWGTAKNLCNFDGDGSNYADFKAPSANYGFLSSNQNNGVLIPNGLCNGLPGEFWTVDFAYKPSGAETGTVLDSFFLWKGTYTDNNDRVQWQKYRTFELKNLFKTPDDNEPYIPGNVNIAFSPDGKWGWISLFADQDNNDAEGEDNVIWDAQPWFWYTNDGGKTWSEDPMILNLREMSGIVDSIKTQYLSEGGDTLLSTGIPMVLGDNDIIVDKNGNPHLLCRFANASNAHPYYPFPPEPYTPEKDSTRYFQGFKRIFDLTTSDHGASWCPKFINFNWKYQGTVPGSTNFNFGNYFNASRDKTGEHIFYSWVDDTTGATEQTAMKPDLFHRALRISDGAMTETDAVTLDDNSWHGFIYFPTVAPQVLSRGTGDSKEFIIPTIFLQLETTELQPVKFQYIKNRTIPVSAFIKPVHDAAITKVLQPPAQVCFLNEVPVEIEILNAGTAEIKDSLWVAYSVNGGDPIPEKITLTAPIAPGAKMNYTFGTAAAIPQNGTYVIDIQTLLPLDDICENHLAQQTVRNFGGVAKDLLANTTDKGCGVYTVNSGLDGLTHKWTVDGDVNGETGSMLTLVNTTDGPITYVVDVEVTNDCNGTPEKLTDKITITLNTSPEITLPAKLAFCAKNGAQTLKINNKVADAGYTFEWRLGKTVKGTTNELSVNANGQYKVYIKDNATGCETINDFNLRFWDVSINLNYKDTECETKYLDAEAMSNVAGAGTGVNYTWTFQYNGKDSTVIGPRMPTIVNIDMKPTTYKVVATDTMGCSSSTSSVSITTYTMKDGVSEDKKLWAVAPSNFAFSKVESVNIPNMTGICLESASTTGQTPLTGRWWKFNFGRPAYVPTNANMGSLTTLGDEKIDVYYEENRTGIRQLQMIVSSGICRDTLTYNYTVKKKGDASCLIPDTVSAKWKDCTPPYVGIAPGLDASIQINVFPNPSAGVFNVATKFNKPQSLQLTVYDINGRAVYTTAADVTQQYYGAIDLSHLSAGVYVLKVETEGRFNTIRLLKD